jgi:hypothetical protein
MQTDHFDFFDPVPSRDELEKAVEHMLNGYAKTVCRCVLKVAAAREEFTSEDVRPFCEPPHGQENVFSSAMLEAKRMGIIKVLRYENAVRKEAKGRVIPVYTRGFKQPGASQDL